VKKNVRTFLVALMVFAMVAVVVAGCTPAPTTSSTATPAKAKLKTAMVTDVGGLGDKSFNDLSYEGLKRANKDFGVEIKVLESKEQADYERNLTNLANAGYSPIFAVGFLMTDAVSKVSTAFPKTQFGGIDEAFDKAPSNVAGLVFKEQEASYLAGVLAGLAVKDTTIDPRIKNNNIIGFVGGFDVPVIERFRAGFVQGVQSVNPDAKVVAVYAGSFNDQAKGKELGLSLINQGASIIFPVAGATGLGTIQAAKEKGALIIGVDQDQYLSVPDAKASIITSVVKRVDEAVYQTIKSELDGKFAGGTNTSFGLKEGGVALAPYHDFDTKIPQAIKDKVDAAKKDIIDGKVVVKDSLK
jgi:basic membrane protein A